MGGSILRIARAIGESLGAFRRRSNRRLPDSDSHRPLAARACAVSIRVAGSSNICVSTPAILKAFPAKAAFAAFAPHSLYRRPSLQFGDLDLIRLALVLVLALVAAAGVAAEAPKVAPQSPAQVRLSFAPVVKRAAPAVVNVYASRVETMPRNPLFDDPIFRRFFGGGGGEDERVQKALGSGVIVDPSGLVVTNHHVIEGMTDVKVALADKREFEADIVLRDPRTDLAVLRIKGGRDFPTLELGDSDALEVGDFVIAIGDPFGVGQTVTQGIVSALARTQVGISDYGFFIQTDAAINPGNSGGALVDLDGKLIGINSAIYSRSGGSMGIGFAIPVNMVKGVVAAARQGGKIVKRPWLGAKLQNVSKDIAESLGLERPAGALVASVFENGPAAEAGLKRGDVITGVDGQSVEDAESVGFRLAMRPLGGSSKLKALRDGRTLELALKLVSAPETPPRDTITIKSSSPFAGAEVMNLSPAVLEELSLAGPREGVVVAAVAEGSMAAQVGVQKGDVVAAVNGHKIATTRDLANACAERTRLWDLVIERGGQTIRTRLEG
ncbi:MAG: DegQ family serine endoprotease [Hyphomicrobiales bacterium]|nr:DegQ family serine endoprotease [Hyphomicrobiales bacterium]